jgi:hypothetical protein
VREHRLETDVVGRKDLVDGLILEGRVFDKLDVFFLEKFRIVTEIAGDLVAEFNVLVADLLDALKDAGEEFLF